MAKCRVCGAPHRACGPASTVIPVDSNITIRGADMSELKRYEVTVEGRRPTTTTLLLSDEDAKRMGLVEAKAAAAPDNKARTARNKAAKPAASK